MMYNYFQTPQEPLPHLPALRQIRTRQCHLDGGKGVVINSIEPCLPPAMAGTLQVRERRGSW